LFDFKFWIVFIAICFENKQDKVCKILRGGKEFCYLSEILMVLQQSWLLHPAFRFTFSLGNWGEK